MRFKSIIFKSHYSGLNMLPFVASHIVITRFLFLLILPTYILLSSEIPHYYLLLLSTGYPKILLWYCPDVTLHTHGQYMCLQLSLHACETWQLSCQIHYTRVFIYPQVWGIVNPYMYHCKCHNSHVPCYISGLVA